jgi:hypothetical protein
LSTSGSSNWNQTRNEIINAALRKCGMLAEGETASAQMVTDAAGDLNRLVKAWHAKGVKLWTYSELRLFLDTTSQSYDLSTSGDHCVLESSLVTTELDADAASGASTITVDSATGISTTYNIGVVQDDDTIHWTTVNGAPAGAVVTLTAVLTAAASSGNAVYVYQNKAPRPLRIEQARVQIDDDTENELRKLGREEYFRLPNKSAAGVPNSFHYNPGLTTGKLYIWPVASTVDYSIKLTAYRVIEDFDTASDNPDFPQEWLQALIWALAREISIEYGTDPETTARIERMADYHYREALNFDTDTESVVFTPDLSGG